MYSEETSVGKPSGSCNSTNNNEKSSEGMDKDNTQTSAPSKIVLSTKNYWHNGYGERYARRANCDPAMASDIRKEEVLAIRNRFPKRVPVMLARFAKETCLPVIAKSKFLVPGDLTMAQFQTIIRNKMNMKSTQTMYLLVNNKSIMSLSLTLDQVYANYAGTDGFLYVTYASQEVFGYHPVNNTNNKRSYKAN